jgi:catechol 2,3-dioxygenase-like lactoylglutathione lyase family enzyme
MIDHMSLVVSDYEKSKAFYLAALEPLGYELVMELSRKEIPNLPFDKGCGLGAHGKPDLWLHPGASVVPTHIAFRAATRDLVRDFHEAALAAGARDNGPPGLREHYHPNYFGAFVLDPDGYNIEAVCHDPE